MTSVLWPHSAQAGRLDSVRDEVSGSSSSSDDDGGSSSSSDYDDYDDYDYGSGSSGSSSSSSSSSSFDGRSRSPAPSMRFRSFPYADGGNGYLFPLSAEPEPDPNTDTDIDADEPAATGRRFSGRISAEGAWQGKGLWRSAGGIRLDGPILGFDGDLSYYLEPAANDALYLGTFNVDLIPLHARRAIWRLGGGLNTMIDGRVPGQGHREYALGWNVTTSFDFFPAFPVVISGRADVGRLYAAWMSRARGSIGIMMGRMELLAGYEHTQVGRVGMGGPLVGLRLWL